MFSERHARALETPLWRLKNPSARKEKGRSEPKSTSHEDARRGAFAGGSLEASCENRRRRGERECECVACDVDVTPSRRLSDALPAPPVRSLRLTMNSFWLLLGTSKTLRQVKMKHSVGLGILVSGATETTVMPALSPHN